MNKTTDKTANRLAYIDITKACAIILVVIGHIIFFSLFAHNKEAGKELLIYKLLDLFQMPLFLFCSGLVIRTSAISVSDSFRDCYKRFRQLIVPMIIIGLLYNVVNGKSSYDFLFNTMKSGYWYLLTLFELYVLSYPMAIISNYVHKPNCNIVIDLCYCSAVYATIFFLYRNVDSTAYVWQNILSMRQLKYYYVFFSVAYLIKKYNKRELLVSNEYLFIISLAISIFSIYGYTHNLYIRGMDKIFPWAMILCTLFVTRYLSDNCTNACKTLRYIGKNTLDIYLFHYFIVASVTLPFIRSFLSAYNSFFLSILILVPIALVIIFCSIMMGKILHCSQLINKVLFYRKD